MQFRAWSGTDATTLRALCSALTSLISRTSVESLLTASPLALSRMTFDPNPRERIGGNGGPPLDDDLADPLFIDKRIVAEAVEYLQFRAPSLSRLLDKRKDARAIGYRKVMEYCLKGLVSNDSLHKILKINRKTIGEDQQRPERWAEIDDEFAEQVEHLRNAIIGHVSINMELFEEKLLYFLEIDPKLRDEEKKERLAALGERRKEIATLAEKERGRVAGMEGLRKTLKGVKEAEAIIASHLGPKEVAKRLSRDGLAAIERLVKRYAKGEHPRTSTLNEAGLKECLRFGLARDAEPHLSKAEDRQMAPTPLGARVYSEALALNILAKPKREPRAA
jgi:hypothetical protein